MLLLNLMQYGVTAVVLVLVAADASIGILDLTIISLDFVGIVVREAHVSIVIFVACLRDFSAALLSQLLIE